MFCLVATSAQGEQQTFDLMPDGCGGNLCSCVTPGQSGVPYEPSALAICKVHGFKDIISFVAVKGPEDTAQCNADASSCFMNASHGNLVCKSVTCSRPDSAPNPAAGGGPDPQGPSMGAIAAQTNAPVITEISSLSSKNPQGQKESAEIAFQAYQEGANQAATLAALHCADSANATVRGSANHGAAKLDTCKDEFAAANNMLETQAKLGGPGELAVVENTVNQEGSKAILSAFSKNFHISADDYLHRMLTAKGNMSTFSDMLKGKLSSDQLGALAKGNEPGRGAPAPETQKSSADSSDLAVNLASGGSSGSIRKILKKKMTESDEDDEESAPVKPFFGRAVGEEKLSVAEEALFRVEREPKTELSLFDVVHLKYRAKTKMMTPERIN